MEEQQQLADLRARIAELEAENEGLRHLPVAHQGETPATSRRRPRGVSIIAAVLIVVSVVVAPIAVLGTWARAQLVDTETFTATFAPLAEEATVQAYLTDQVMVGIEENVDIDGIINDVFTGIADLDMPPRAQAMLPLLQGPAAEGMRSIIRGGVERVIASPQFAQLWQTVLRQSHAQAVALLQESPDSAFELAQDGTLSIRLGTLITEVKQVLVDQGFGFAESIPVVERSIPIVEADALVTVRALYQVATTVGYLLPWVVLGMLVLGVALARRKMRALTWAAAGFALSFISLGAGVGIGRAFFIGTISPSVMPAATASVMFDHVTAAISSTVTALVVLSIFLMIGAWFAGGSTRAQRVRGALDSGFGSVRAAADRHGLHTRSVGVFVERWHRALVLVAVLLAAVVLFMIRPVTIASVVTTVLVLLAVLLVLELVRRPQPLVTPQSVESSAG